MPISWSVSPTGKIGRGPDQYMLWPCSHLQKFVGACVTEKLHGRLKGLLKGIRITITGAPVNEEALHASPLDKRCG